MTEPAVTLTDYLLALECGVFAWLVHRHPGGRPPLRDWFALFFASVGAASLFGGTVHGFFPREAELGYRLLWPATLLAIGVTTWVGWLIGAEMGLSRSGVRWISGAASLSLVVYTAIVFLATQAFWIAIVYYLPATLFLLASFLLAHRRRRSRGPGVAALGLALTLVAALAQQSDIAVHSIYLDHNALYHLIQFVALLLVFWGARRIVETPAGFWRERR